MIDVRNCDCLELMAELDDCSVDLLVTDPPYRVTGGGCTFLNDGNFGIADGENVRNGKLFKHNDIEFGDWLSEAYRVLNDGSHAYIMTNDRNLANLILSAEAAGFKLLNILVWDKRNAVLNKYYMKSVEFIAMFRKGTAKSIKDRGTSSLISIPNEVGRKHHPTQKPQALFEVFIRNSANSLDLVLDPFVGAGASALAAKALNVDFVGSEIDPTYYYITKRRLESCQMALI